MSVPAPPNPRLALLLNNMHDAFDLSPSPVVSGIQDRVESVLLHGNRLYLGCQNGSLHVYTLVSEDGKTSATLDKVIKGFTKKSIEQLGVIKETNSLVALSDGIVYLNDLHTYEKHHVLGSSSQTKGQASVFALDTSIQTSGPSLSSDKEKEKEKSRSSKSPAKAKTGKGAQSRAEQDQAGVPTVVTTLAVACRRRMVLFGWRDGQWQEPRDVSLPHQVRSIAFPLPHTLFLGFSTLEYGIMKLPSLANSSSGAASLGELFKADFTPPPPAAVTSSSSESGSSAQSGTTLGAIPGLGALGGLASKTGGYIGFGGIGKVERNAVVKTKAGEVMILKDDMGVMLDTSGKPSRQNSIEYALRPDESVTCWPYLVSLLPAPASLGTLSKQQAQDPLTALPSLHIHSLAQLTPVQAIRVPAPDRPTVASRPVSIIDVPPPPVTQAARLLATSSNGKAPLAVITHPLQETATTKYQVHLLTLRSWTAQLDALVASGQYEEAQSLLSSIDAPELVIPDAAERMKKLRALAGLTTFLDKRKYEAAIDLFIDENINPAKVVALFPKAISGKLFLPREEVEEIWGGRTADRLRAQEQEAQQASTPRRGMQRSRNVSSETVGEGTNAADTGRGMEGEDTASTLGTSPAPSSKWGFSPARRKQGEGKEKDDDTASIRSVLSKRSQLLPSFTGRDTSPAPTAQVIDRESSDDQSHKLSVDVLMRYLPDRRQHILRALAALPLRDRPTPSSPQPTSLSNAPEDLFKLPDAPLSTYTPDQLQRTAQVVETALFKCYLHAKPGLLGPLCRIENWCEVEEVEELLLEAKKYRELLDLYNGKAMHQKALRLLQRMADDPPDKPLEDKVEPTVAYLHKLGAQHLDLIFEGARWVFSLDQEAGLKIFTADLEEVESLPRHAVLSYLSRTTTAENTAKYLEHVIHHLHEDGPEFHERLIELYLDDVEKGKAENADQSAYSRLIDFMETSTQYRADRLLGRIPDDRMFEVRAILLGRLGQHDGALHIYVYRLGNHAQAEEYCKRIYNNEADPARSSIFLMLLKVYLRPRQQSGQPPMKQEPLLKPAIALLSTQGTRMDANAALELLPPLVSIRELQTFLQKTVRKTVQVRNAKKVESKVRTARRDQVERELVDLEGRRVKITDGRLCPQCHKRLGNSVIAIHNPNGEVTHYQCRERWQEAKLQSSRSVVGY